MGSRVGVGTHVHRRGAPDAQEELLDCVGELVGRQRGSRPDRESRRREVDRAAERHDPGFVEELGAVEPRLEAGEATQVLVRTFLDRLHARTLTAPDARRPREAPVPLSRTRA